jgi:8-oxo-dGTP pyrophosphatase MutT (NUDIX family)
LEQYVMIPSLSQEIQNELTQLAQRYGQPLVRTADLGITSLFDPLDATDRYGEVCMVVRRPNGKTFYPKGAFRLMTGGINFGENILDALVRETYEETSLTVNVNRFLTAITYTIAGTDNPPVFYTFAFLLDETGGTLGVIDEKERVEAFREIAPEELPKLADYLTQVQDEANDEIRGNWHDWGVFRAVIHRAVWDALEQKQ